MRLIGRNFADPDVQNELKTLPFETSVGQDGGILIRLKYLCETHTFTPVQIMAMLFSGYIDRYSYRISYSAIRLCCLIFEGNTLLVFRPRYLKDDVDFICRCAAEEAFHDSRPLLNAAVAQPTSKLIKLVSVLPAACAGVGLSRSGLHGGPRCDRRPAAG